MITAAALRERLATLEGIGVGPDRAVHRLAWTAQDAAARRWFEAQAEAAGLSARRDPAGNLWACPRSAEAPWWVVGSHLDSVRGGGRFDGPLGVVGGFEIATATSAPVAVVAFADEEGARFNTPTFGSKALTGRLDLPDVLHRRDEHGIALGQAMAEAGVDPDGLRSAPAWLERVRGFVEIHIDQSTEVAAADVPVAIVHSLAARVRLEVEVRGRADHAGTTPPSERRDALAAAARIIAAAEDLAAGGSSGLRVTTARLHVEPNAATTIAARVRLWVDARAPAEQGIEAWRHEFERALAELGERRRVQIAVTVASRSGAREFSPAVRAALGASAAAELGHAVPECVCFAGHDAGVLAERVPAAMVLVRNRAGLSHAPEEDVDLDDAAMAARVVRRMIEETGP